MPGSSIASTTSTQLSSLYPTPATTVSSSSAYRLGGPASSGAANSGAGIRTGGSGMPGQAPYAPSIRTAGDSWSLQRDGEKTVIVIEDTPPPTTSTNVASTRTSAIASSSRLPAANGAPNKRVKVGGYPQSNDVYASSYQQPNYGVDTLSIAAHPATASTSAYHPDASAAASTSNANRKVSGAKRKFNEVNDPATAVSIPSLKRWTMLRCAFDRMIGYISNVKMQQLLHCPAMTRTDTILSDRMMS